MRTSSKATFLIFYDYTSEENEILINSKLLYSCEGEFMGVAFGSFPLKFGRLLIHTNINIHFTFQFFKLLVKTFSYFSIIISLLLFCLNKKRNNSIVSAVSYYSSFMYLNYSKGFLVSKVICTLLLFSLF